MTLHNDQQAPPVPPLVAALLRGGQELRSSQVELAMLVQQALIQEIPAIIEAATGVGKTMGYLVPALLSGKTIVVSTANKALQEQIFYKDVPFLQKNLQPFNAAMMKGVSNYVCLDRLHEMRKDLRMFDQYPLLQSLLDATNENRFTGDFEMLDFTISADLRGHVNGDSDQCAWKKCGWFDHCYIRAMRERAKNAQVLVVNHTLLLLDVATGHAILPPYDVLVLDEAHHLADEATSAFTVEVRPSRVTSLLQQRLVKAHTSENLYKEVVELQAQLWSRLEKTPFGKVPLKQPIDEALQLATKIGEIATELQQRRPDSLTEKEATLYDKVVARARNLASDIRLVFAVETNGDYVHFIDHGTSVAASAAPLDVAPFLKEKLFDMIPTVIMVSATLATTNSTNGSFAYFRKQVGLVEREEIIEKVLPHVFDYQHNALLYVPRDVPEPVYGQGQAAQLYTQAIADRMKRLVMASHGRAFLLFSSRRMMEEVYGRIERTLPYTVLRQGDMNRGELLKRFRDEGAVLFGLKTFWEGVDIAGDALSLETVQT